MAVCPVSRVTPRFPGPKQAGPGAQRFRSASEVSVDDWIELCTACRLCDTACPAGVPISELNLMAKAKYLDERGRTFRDWLLVRSDLFGELASRFSRIVNPLMKNRTIRWFLDKFLEIDRRRALPDYESPTFRQWFGARLRQVKPPVERGSLTSTAASRIPTKLMWERPPWRSWRRTAFRSSFLPALLRHPRLGVGDLRGAREMGRRNLSLLLPTVQEGVDIVFSSTSCGLMLRHEYGPLLNLPGAEELAKRLFDICELLLRLHEKGSRRCPLDLCR